MPGPSHRLVDADLLFVPSATSSGRLSLDPPRRYALIYRAAGVIEAWSSAQPKPPQQLERLIGHSRATLLMTLAEPASTTQLVAQLGMSLGATGDHLSVLRDAGLVSRSRSGRSVHYRRTVLWGRVSERLNSDQRGPLQNQAVCGRSVCSRIEWHARGRQRA
jgi:DNA-binding transcriptional ArsR family regulator